MASPVMQGTIQPRKWMPTTVYPELLPHYGAEFPPSLPLRIQRRSAG